MDVSEVATTSDYVRLFTWIPKKLGFYFHLHHAAYNIYSIGGIDYDHRLYSLTGVLHHRIIIII